MVNAYLPSIFTEAHCFEVRLNLYILFETILLYFLANLPNSQDPISMASCEAQQFFYLILFQVRPWPTKYTLGILIIDIYIFIEH